MTSLPTSVLRLDRDAELDEALDLAIEDVLRQHPVGNAAAIEPAGLRRLLEDRDRVAEARQLVRGAVSGRTRSDDRDLLAVGRAGLDDVVRQRLSEVAEKPLDRADRRSPRRTARGCTPARTGDSRRGR